MEPGLPYTVLIAEPPIASIHRITGDCLIAVP
jgi:hypothetical protein